jgi:hypothetical protein
VQPEDRLHREFLEEPVFNHRVAAAPLVAGIMRGDKQYDAMRIK